MHILHVTPHLPPDQAANALLPSQLGLWTRQAGGTVEYVAHPPRAGGAASLAGPVRFVARRKRTVLDRALRLGALLQTWRIHQALDAALERADVVHVHSNGLLAELAVVLARKRGRPVILTLYGTEIWHYVRRRFGPDLFTRAYHGASVVTFYSKGLLARARELGLARRQMQAVYPPVGTQFVWHGYEQQAAARAALGIANRHLLVNVKRLHPLAGQRYLIEAMADVVRIHPDTRLILCGAGPLADDLRRVARTAGVERHVTFAGSIDNRVIAGYYAAADLFVLPSLLEALPTVAVEALACGTPVVSTDNPGGVELHELLGPDVRVVPREQPAALSRAIVEFLEHKRRTNDATRRQIEREFSPAAISARYAAIYEQVAAGGFQ